jgi:2'-5' RNA ligase
MDTSAQIQSLNRSLPLGHGYQFEYMLIASPCKEVYNQVMEEKQQFYTVYQEKIAIKTKPHITIANFLAKEAMEETIIRWMNRAIGMQPRFSVLLNNFGGFPPHTIYIRIQQPQPFKQLAAALHPIDQYVRSNNCPPMHLVTNPHLSLARRLPPNVFETAMLDYSQKTFHASFQISELVLLRRQHQYDSCKQISSFHLAP